MKSTTEYWFGSRHVGDSQWVVKPKLLSVKSMAQEMMRVMITVSLATRLEFVIARTEDEVRNRLMEHGNTGKSKKSADDDIANLFDQMLADMDIESLD